MNWEQMWDILLEEFGVSEETLRIVTDINGCNEETMEDILYAVSGYRSFEQAGYYEDEEDIEGCGLLSELYPQYDSRASFYGKAKIIESNDGTVLSLISYNTTVATFDRLSGALDVFGYYSSTTARHIREFARQLGIDLPSGKDIQGTYYA